jgi:hypothetical protein
MADLRDYKRGALGNVLELEPQFLDLLRVAESEESAWESAQTKAITVR